MENQAVPMANKKIKEATKVLKVFGESLIKGVTTEVPWCDSMFLAAAELNVWREILRLAQNKKDDKSIAALLTLELVRDVSTYGQSSSESASRSERAEHAAKAEAIRSLEGMPF